MDQALRRAASWGCLLEMKILLKNMPIIEINVILNFLIVSCISNELYFRQ
jgi:hypothetical protein